MRKLQKLKKMEENKYKIPSYVDAPSEEELYEQYMLFRDCNTVTFRKVELADCDEFHALKEESIFAYATTLEVACAIKVLLMSIMREFNELLVYNDTSPSPKADAESYGIYLTTREGDDRFCLLCDKYSFDTREARQAHYDLHKKDVQRWNWFKEAFQSKGNQEGLRIANRMLDWPERAPSAGVAASTEE